MRKLIAMVLFLLIAASAPAAAITADEQALTKMAATLVYGESRCPQFEGNMQGLAIVATSRHFSPDDWKPGGRLRSLLVSQIQVVKAEFDSTEDKMFCVALETAFGPKGVKAPGAIRRRHAE